MTKVQPLTQLNSDAARPCLDSLTNIKPSTIPAPQSRLGSAYRFLFDALIRHADPEAAHSIALRGMRIAGRAHLDSLLAPHFFVQDPRLTMHVAGLTFRNPVGLAAGFDKDGVAVDFLAALGFGAIEVGSVCPKPQSGTSSRRLWRFNAERAVVNHMGFNSVGAQRVRQNLKKSRNKLATVGVSLGMNHWKEPARAAEDYCRVAEEMQGVSQYLVINISSPNTVALRELENTSALRNLIREVQQTIHRAPNPSPVFLKISPDIPDNRLRELAESALQEGIAGFIASNTTTDFSASEYVEAVGGLSGRPLRARSTSIVRELHRVSSGKVPIIGVGGISTWQDALEKIAAGASLVQLLTGFVFEGPTIARDINLGLCRWMKDEGVSSLAEVVGCNDLPRGEALEKQYAISG